MWIDITPLKKNRDFRYLYFGQFVSFFGTMLTLVAIPYQVYQLTQSTLLVGLLSIAELVPLLLTAFIGGILADTLDRKKLLLYSEAGMAIGCLLLILQSLLPQPQMWLIFIIAAWMSALSGLHRPALGAMLPRLVDHHEIQSMSVLGALKTTVCMIGGPAIAGISLASLGLVWTYTFDLFTFLFSLGAISKIKFTAPLQQQESPSLKNAYEAILYAIRRQELLGTYLIDFAAMVFAMPNALFPAIAQSFGNSKMLGWLYSAPAIGALIVTLTSGWVKKIKFHGRAVAFAALGWGVAIALFGASHQLIWVLFFLILAGMADCVSGIFRSTLWNETIPDRIRGRMASLELISYMSGPLLGNAQAGFLASVTGVPTAIMTGGSLCVVGVTFCIFLLPQFWQYYQKSKASSEESILPELNTHQNELPSQEKQDPALITPNSDPNAGV